MNSNFYLDKIGNIARSGIAVYGIDPEGRNAKLKPVLQFKTKLIQIKNITKGECIGYNFTYCAKKDIKIGVLPAGYFDGLDRRLSNNGFVTIEDKPFPVIGRVSMNLTLVDLTNCENPYVGQSVTIYSAKRIDMNSVFNSSSFCKTIPYDLLVGLASATKRILNK